MSAPNIPELHLDRSGPNGIRFEQAGGPVALEAVFRTGFVVRPDDVPAVLTLVAQYLEARDERQK